MSWRRCHGKALADAALTGEALDCQLEDYIRLRDPQLTDIRLERATPARAQEAHEGDSGVAASQRWYDVTYLAND